MGADPNNKAALFRFGAFELDERNRELRDSGLLIDVPPQAFKILTMLVRRSQELVTREEIRNVLWPAESSGDFDSRLNFEIRRIREALHDDADRPRYVATVRKRGYKFIASVQESQLWSSSPQINTGVVRGSTTPAADAIERPVAAGILSSVGEPSGGGQSASSRSGLGRMLRVGLLLMALGLALFSIWAWRRPYDDDIISRMAFVGSDLVAWNARGGIIWTFNFGQPLRDEPPDATERLQRVTSPRHSQEDVLAMAPLLVGGQPNPSSDALYRLSPNGKLLWCQGFEDRMEFGGRDYGPPWGFGALVSIEDEPTPSIWCAVRSQYWSPSLLVKLDGDGNRISQFVNWGHILNLNHVRESGDSYILAGGINNECNCAMLAVLREDHPSGSSPPLPGSDLSCQSCPPGQPYRYLIFPRSELSSLSGATYNQVKLIQTDGGRVNVAVRETDIEEGLGPDWEMYDLSESFVPQSYTVSDHYLELHRQMEREGKIHHSVKQCPELTQPRTVRIWSPEGGWKEVRVPRVDK
ncbi:MAG TPA: winged helix-turn-helix domain-containing protein [Terriglobales bacterium]|nr:winged helix-turn-helix domain-containing protein [Terriglobales bacterium]